MFLQNNLLKTSNEELRARLQIISEENQRLKGRLGVSTRTSSSDHEYAAPCPISQTSLDSEHSYRTISEQDCDSDHVVIKSEEESTEYASFRTVSLQQKFQILLLALTTIWLHSLR